MQFYVLSDKIRERAEELGLDPKKAIDPLHIHAEAYTALIEHGGPTRDNSFLLDIEEYLNLPIYAFTKTKKDPWDGRPCKDGQTWKRLMQETPLDTDLSHFE